ncbi:uncharacterized protein C8orf48 homolog isoform X2 [Hyperolius riggenbachi]|uniref:uncharacterized protein C8orf48 homolog isoform X2 n=1 Tax=Hyperolius riggenbachi TaxID=752182 RepID=UPI0035A2D21A
MRVEREVIVPGLKMDVGRGWQEEVAAHRANQEELLEHNKSVNSAASYTSGSFESITDEPSWNYESDSFESVTDESAPDYENDSFESFSSHVDFHHSSDPETSSITSEAFEDISESNKSGRDLIEKWVAVLERKLQSPNSYKRHPNSAHCEPTANENPNLQSYCTKKIQHLHQRSTRKQKKQHPAPPLRRSAEKHPSCHIPNQLINRLQLQNFKHTMEQVIHAEMHDPNSCPDCSLKQAEFAQSRFVRMRKTKLEASLLQIKLEEYTYSKDLLTCIGEIHQSLPNPSDVCPDIWQRLYAKSKS